MKSACIAVALAVTGAVGCSADAPVEVEHQIALSRTVKMVPFTGRHMAVIADASSVSCPDGQRPGRSTITAGNATHLGTFTGEARSCAIGTTFVSASLTWIGANGDQVLLSLDADAEQVVVIDFPIVTVTVEFDITGGTGRFDEATGHVVTTTGFNLVTNVNQTTWEGTISSLGSIKWSNP